MIEIDNTRIPPGEIIGQIEHSAPQRGIIFNTDGSARPFQVTNPYDWGVPHLSRFLQPGDYQMSVESIRKGYMRTSSGRAVKFAAKIPEYGQVYVNPNLHTSATLREEGTDFLEIPNVGLYAKLPSGRVRPIYDQDSVLFHDFSDKQ